MYILSCLLYIKSNITNYDFVSSGHDYQTHNRMNIYQDKTKYTLTPNSFHYNSVKLYDKIKDILQSNPLYSVNDFYNLF